MEDLQREKRRKINESNQQSRLAALQAQEAETEAAAKQYDSDEEVRHRQINYL